MIGPAEFLRIAVDPVRLAVLGQAVVGPVDAAAVAAATGVGLRRVRREIGGLVEVGLLTRSLELDRAALREIAIALPQAAPADASVTARGVWTADEEATLGRMFSGTRLVAIPVAHDRRRLLLDRLAQEFEPGLRYDERDVNATLGVFHDDYAALRRYMVDEGFLTRAEGWYWRSGGRVGPPDG